MSGIMSAGLFLPLRRAVLIALVTFALLATGLAHRAPSATDNAWQGFMLAGGGMGDLCGTADDPGMPGRDKCPVCQLSAAADLPPPQGIVQDAGLTLLAEIGAPRQDTVLSAVQDLSHSPRAPPQA